MPKEQHRVTRSDFIAILIILIVSTALFAPMMHRWRLMGDYGGNTNTHNELAYRLTEDPAEFYRNTPHFLYHSLTAGVYWLSPDKDIYVAGVRVMVITYLILGILLYWHGRNTQSWSQNPLMIGSMVCAVLGLLLIAPITFFTPDNLYFGYFVPHVYHNPTVQLLKPFALSLFLLAIPLFNTSQNPGWNRLPAYALLTAASVFAKPNFVLSFVPALGIVTAYYGLRHLFLESRKHPEKEALVAFLLRVYKSAPIHWVLLLGGIVLPTFAILFYQTLTWTSAGGITFDPFRVFYEWTLHYEPNADKSLMLKFVMSAALPISVYLLHWREAIKSLMLNLAWINFLISVAYAILMVDQSVVAAGDFSWGAQIGMLLLQAVSIFFLFGRYTPMIENGELARSSKITLLICVMVFFLHVFSGANWYLLHLQQDAISLIYGAW